MRSDERSSRTVTAVSATRRLLLAILGVGVTALVACAEMPWQSRPSCTSSFAPPTRTLNVIFWHAGGSPSDLTLSFDDHPLSGRLRIHEARGQPAVAAECTVGIPALAGQLRACAVRTRRCTVIPLPAAGDLWVQLDVANADSVVLGGGPDLYPPAID